MPGRRYGGQPLKSVVSLRILVVGGSIGGLATAYALQKAGHDVVVLEQSDGKTRSLGGLRCPPNMTRILARWGFEPYLAKYGVKCPQFRFQKGETGKLISVIKIHDEFLKDLMADFIFMQHGDLQSILLDVATREGVKIRYNTKVLCTVSETMSVNLESGETLYSDLVVGADGPQSVVRSAVIGETITGPIDDSLCLTFSVPIDLMRADEDLKHLTELSDWLVWLGDGYMLHAHAVHGRREFSVLLAYQMDADKAAVYGEGWNTEYSLDQFELDFDIFEPRARKLLKLAQHITPTSHTNLPPVESLVCDQAKVVIVGEAAHSITPNGMHNTAMAIEDAETLGSLFSRIQFREEIPRLLSAYEELRLARCNHTQEWERRKRQMLRLRDSPAQRHRDAEIRKGAAHDNWEHMDETSFRQVWGDELDLYAYDATEKVDDWWTKWGSFISEPRRNSTATPPTPTVQVSISNDR